MGDTSDGQADFGVSETTPTTADYQKVPDLQLIPVLGYAVIFFANIPLSSGVDLIWTREIVVGVMNGSISTWDHKSIRAMNPFVDLPSKPLVLCLLVKYVEVKLSLPYDTCMFFWSLKLDNLFACPSVPVHDYQSKENSENYFGEVHVLAFF